MSSSIVADLHSHTTASDGTLTIEEIPTAAKEAGINWVAVTDRDILARRKRRGFLQGKPHVEEVSGLKGHKRRLSGFRTRRVVS